MMGVVWRVALLIITAILLQTTVLVDLRILGVAPDLMLVVAVAAGITGGPGRGAVVGFAGGLTLDLFLATPFGMAALSYAITAYVLGHVEGSLVAPGFTASFGLTAIGSVMGVGGYVVLGVILGQDAVYSRDFWKILAVVTVLNAWLAPFASRVLLRIWNEDHSSGGPRPAALPDLVR